MVVQGVLLIGIILMSFMSPKAFVYLRGTFLGIATLLTIGSEVLDMPELRVISGIMGGLFLISVVRYVRWSRQLFIAIGVVASLLAVLTRPDGWSLIADALGSGGYVLSFFVGLSTLRTAAMSSPSIQACGEYLSTRTPGKRYVALTVGGHLFSLVLNYGSISLLGALVDKADGGDGLTLKNPERVRRMLLAIQRGFVATLCWSPLTFSMAMGTAVIEGSSWNGVVWYGLVSAVLLMLVGWGLDTVLKSKASQSESQTRQIGNLSSIRPLLILLLVIFTTVGALELLSGYRIVIIVMMVVPLISLGWIALQNRTYEQRDGNALGAILRQRTADYIGPELDGYKGEMVLLYIAAYVGKLGGVLAAPLISEQILDLSTLPTEAILFGIIIGLPILGQLGMHPILAVTMLGPLLPTPAAMGVSPDIVLAAICIGWAFGGATSPFTATVLLVAMYGKVKATTVGLIWNRWFVAAGSVVGMAWIMLISGGVR